MIDVYKIQLHREKGEMQQTNLRVTDSQQTQEGIVSYNAVDSENKFCCKKQQDKCHKG